MSVSSSELDGVARRRLLAGAGAGAAALVGLAATAAATARPAAADSDTAAGSTDDAVINATPVVPALGSPALSGYTYRYLSFFDFTPEGTSSRSWGGYGVYTTSSDYLWASLDIPAGSRVRDIEWYLHNSTGSTYTALGRVWTAGNGSLVGPLVDIPVSSGTGIRAFRAAVPSATYGPFPLGCKVMLGISSLASGAVQVNGARVGLSHNGGAAGLLPAPVRAYDSRVTGGKLAPSVGRTITLPSSVVPVGASAILANVIIAQPEGSGYLKVWPGDAASPDVGTINFQSGENIANGIPIGVSASRQIKVWSTKRTHVIIDVSGTIG